MPLGDLQEKQLLSDYLGWSNKRSESGMKATQRARLHLDNEIPRYEDNAINNKKVKNTNMIIRLRYRVGRRISPYYSIMSDMISSSVSNSIRVKSYKEFVEKAKKDAELGFILKYTPQLNQEMFDLVRINQRMTFQLNFDYIKLVKDIGMRDIREHSERTLQYMKKYNREEYDFLVKERGYPEV